ncbi:MAG TPA: Hpt domain-containing protein [Terriglobales bacterium]|jgi:HPt (histidine-containing phosphotransfer) domain-containing protein|nr:Hpt domain-containing protein [Terriglobales bacterium]
MSELVLAPEIFDRLRQATAGDSATLAELCREYVIEARATITNIRQALARKDAAQLRDRAHYLKGSSMMIGAKTLSLHCATLEKMGRDSDLGEADAALDQAAVALKAVEEELAKCVGAVALPAEGSAA